MSALVRNRIIVGDAASEMAKLPSGQIDTIITSPPYFGLRDYQVEGQLGLETHVDDWVEGLATVAREAARVITSGGSLWLNVGDSYSIHPRQGAERKSLLLGPERLVRRLSDQGWILRNKLIWSKSNPVPTSVRDRLTASHEYIYLLVRSPQYFFDLDAIRIPHTSSRKTAPKPHARREREAWRGRNSSDADGLDKIKAEGRVGHVLGKNPGDSWRLASSNHRGAHHATFPVALVERMLLAGCPEARCSVCRLPYRRSVIRSLAQVATRGALTPSCTCRAPAEPGLVLDPFIGAGTTAIAAEAHGRDWLGIELNPQFAAQARQRIASSRDQAHPPNQRTAA